MLTPLATVKARLLITDTTDDTLLTNFINQAGALFDRFCNRTFARADGVFQEFRGDEVEFALARYPVEVIAAFDLKSSENTSWLPVFVDDYVVRFDCVLSLRSPLGSPLDQARVMYSGGYVLPGTTPDTGQTALPADIEQACVEQVAHWYRTRNLLGVSSASGQGGSVAFDAKSVVTPLDLLPMVQNVLQSHRRIQL